MPRPASSRGAEVADDGGVGQQEERLGDQRAERGDGERTISRSGRRTRIWVPTVAASAHSRASPPGRAYSVETPLTCGYVGRGASSTSRPSRTHPATKNLPPIFCPQPVDERFRRSEGVSASITPVRPQGCPQPVHSEPGVVHGHRQLSTGPVDNGGCRCGLRRPVRCGRRSSSQFAGASGTGLSVAGPSVGHVGPGRTVGDRRGGMGERHRADDRGVPDEPSFEELGRRSRAVRAGRARPARPDDRTPPQDIAAEQSRARRMLISKDAIADVVEVDPRHRLLPPGARDRSTTRSSTCTAAASRPTRSPSPPSCQRAASCSGSAARRTCTR